MSQMRGVEEWGREAYLLYDDRHHDEHNEAGGHKTIKWRR
jgi:hypothetical protein